MDLTAEFQKSYERIKSNNTVAGIVVVDTNGLYYLLKIMITY